jgi:hypothetical protein
VEVGIVKQRLRMLNTSFCNHSVFLLSCLCILLREDVFLALKIQMQKETRNAETKGQKRIGGGEKRGW